MIRAPTLIRLIPLGLALTRQAKRCVDWRRHFFINNLNGSGKFDPQVDNISGGSFNGINDPLLEDGYQDPTLELTTTDPSQAEWKINYNAVLAWLKAGPRVFPDNLYAGRCVYYSAIPTTIPGGSMSDDQRFWREYH